MVGAHLLRPFSARQLGLVESDDDVVVFAVLGGRSLGPTPLAHRPTLEMRLAQAMPGVTGAVFIDDPYPTPSMCAVIDDMLSEFEGGGDALVRTRPVTEAMKRVTGDRVAGSVDRTRLASVTVPVLVRVESLRAALSGVGDLWVSPAHLVLAAGGDVRVSGLAERAPA